VFSSPIGQRTVVQFTVRPPSRYRLLPATEFEQRYRAEIPGERPHVLDELRRLEPAHENVWLL
jgi:hypothetical protein